MKEFWSKHRYFITSMAAAVILFAFVITVLITFAGKSSSSPTIHVEAATLEKVQPLSPITPEEQIAVAQEAARIKARSQCVVDMWRSVSNVDSINRPSAMDQIWVACGLKLVR